MRLLNNKIIAAALAAAFLVIATQCTFEQEQKGEKVYNAYCANCHGKQGEGLAELIPPIAKSDWLQQNQDILICFLVNGNNNKVVVNGIEYEGVMPPLPPLSYIQITNLLNYINTSFGNQLPVFRADSVQIELEKCK